MKELRLIEMIGNIDEELLLRANAPVPLFRKPRFRAAMAVAAVAMLLVITMISSPVAVVVSYGNAHPEIEGGLIYIMDAMIEDESHFLYSLLPENMKNTLGSVFDALKGEKDKNEGGNESESESESKSESESESETEPEFVMPPASEGLAFELNVENNGYKLIGIGSCKDKDLVIPSEHNGLPVTEIYWNSTSGNHAFEGNTSIESVIIPNSITAIGEYAFYRCTALRSVIIAPGEAEVVIGYGSFADCDALEEFTIYGNIVRFEDPFCLAPNHSYFEATLPNMTEYGGAYYLGNEQTPYMVLTQVKDANASTCEIHPDTKIIGGGAFYQSALTEITIPEGVITIDYKAFAKTQALTTFSFPESLRFVGEKAFADCGAVISASGLDYVGDAENPYLILFDGDMLTDSIHPDTCYVADDAFADARYNKKTRSLTIPEKMRYIGKYAFWPYQTNPDAISTLTIQGDNLHIEKCAFPQIDLLRSIVIGKGVTYIAPGAFYGNLEGLYTITVEEGNPVYASPGNCLVEMTTGTLLRVCRDSVLPGDGSIKHIATGAFWGRAQRTSDSLDDQANILPEGILNIGSWAFYDAFYQDFILPASATQLGDYALYNMKRITYRGTMEQFRALNPKAFGSGLEYVSCSDGVIYPQQEATG